MIGAVMFFLLPLFIAAEEPKPVKKPANSAKPPEFVEKHKKHIDFDQLRVCDFVDGK